MTSLTPTKISELETRLRRSKADIMEQVRAHLHAADDSIHLALVNHMQEGDDWAVADAMSELDIAVLSHELTELRGIQEALQRIASGRYGICADCGDDIPAERLSAEPVARYCIECQALFEKRHTTLP